MAQITFDVPEGARSALRLSANEFVREMRVAAALLWYSEGRISQSVGAPIADVSRAEFIDQLSRRRIPLVQTTAEELPDGKGQVRQIERCIERAREALAKEERRFQEYLNQVIAALRNGRVSQATSANVHQGTLDVINAWWIQLGDRVDPSDETRVRLVRREYVYSAYFVQRAKRLR